jgi:hypothetical protein
VTLFDPLDEDGERVDERYSYREYVLKKDQLFVVFGPLLKRVEL